MIKVSWNENFKQLVAVEQDLSYLPYISGKLFEQLSDLDLNDIFVRNEIIRSSRSYQFLNWLILQKKLYERKELNWKRIECLQKINFLPTFNQFNQRDLEIYQKYFTNTPDDLKLVKRHIDNYYYSNNQDNYDLNDYFQEVVLGVIQALKTYDNQVNFNEYITRCVFKQLNNNLINNKSQSKDLDTLDNIKQINFENEQIDKIIYSNLFQVINTLSNREKGILLARYIDNKSYSEIGKEYNLTGSRVAAIAKTALCKLRHPSRSKEILSNEYQGKKL